MKNKGIDSQAEVISLLVYDFFSFGQSLTCDFSQKLELSNNLYNPKIRRSKKVPCAMAQTWIIFTIWYFVCWSCSGMSVKYDECIFVEKFPGSHSLF